MSMAQTISGRCECAAVRYDVAGPVRKVVYCHCEQCRRTSGHYVAATACATGDLRLIADDGLRWTRPDGQPLPPHVAAPPVRDSVESLAAVGRAQGADVTAESLRPLWDGSPVDYGCCVEAGLAASAREALRVARPVGQ